MRDASTFPTRRVEDWKWSDLKRFLREAPAVSPAIVVAPGGPFAALGGQEIAFGNGLTVDAASEARFEGAGVLRLRFVSDAQSTGHQASATVVVPAGAELLVLESYEGAGSAYASNVGLTFEVGEGARLTRVVLLEEPEDVISVSVADVTVAPHARYEHTVLASGAKLQRHETRVNHPGHGASVRLDGLYVLAGSRHADLTTVVDHQGVGGVTSQLTKGVVADSARGVFQGRIVVDRGADQTDARMGHHALILSDKAEIDAKPELEIYADDVSCAHGNTIGALDENALFYARARGVPEHEARVMLTQAFLGEVTDRIEHEGAREAAQAWLAERLEALL
nr:Fe-S cluster assembly protein SufD [Caulobacter sp. 17J65-9]